MSFFYYMCVHIHVCFCICVCVCDWGGGGGLCWCMCTGVWQIKIRHWEGVGWGDKRGVMEMGEESGVEGDNLEAEMNFL